MVSIKEVAKHAGVAISTVSKVLNGYPNISEETKQIISGVNEPVTLYLLVQRGQENLIIQELLQRWKMDMVMSGLLC